MNYKKEYIQTFLKNQGQLFDEPDAETIEAAREFLEECMAFVAKDYGQVKAYFEENGADTAQMSREELLSEFKRGCKASLFLCCKEFMQANLDILSTSGSCIAICENNSMDMTESMFGWDI